MFGALLNKSRQYERVSSSLVHGNTIWFDEIFDNVAMTDSNRYGNMD